MVKSVGDNRYFKLPLLYVEKGQADPVEADGAFFDDEVAELPWKPELEFPAAVQLFAFQAGSCRVHMTLHDMAVEAAVHDEASFQVNEVACLPRAQVGLAEGLFDGGDAVHAILYLLHSEAGPVVGETLVDLEFGGNGGFYPEYLVGTQCISGLDRAQ